MNKRINLIFLSGLLCDETVWSEITIGLSSMAKISIVSFKGCKSIEEMAQKVLRSKKEKFFLIGHSMGARVALEVYKQAPQRIKGLGLFNTGVHSSTKDEVSKRQILLDLAKKEGINALAKRWLPFMLCEKSLKNDALMKKLYEMVNTYSVEDYFFQIHALLNRPEAQSMLKDISVPVLLLSAQYDKWSPISQHKEMQKEIRNSTLIEINDASHMAPVEQVKEIEVVIKNWLLAEK